MNTPALKKTITIELEHTEDGLLQTVNIDSDIQPDRIKAVLQYLIEDITENHEDSTTDAPASETEKA
ncbi:hypothetical protein [Persicobacter psychrovividus]|uniref:Uncharacterized protein n=1 Tax=Persicobacter psychrovividus TaxID=387638 RepID=A0ABN6LF40_9BACT|nr:hypothetical protein PEPS_40810 [Persicobacter psychrovividus]